MAEGNHGKDEDVALVFRCLYFLLVGKLAYRHFGKKNGGEQWK